MRYIEKNVILYKLGPAPLSCLLNGRVLYLQYEVAGDQCCVGEKNGLDILPSYFSVSFCYFGLDKQINDKLNTNLKYVVLEGRVVSDTTFIILKFYLLLFSL